jgi:hypothetical protein
VTFAVSLIPPGSFENASVLTYAIALLAGTAILALPPLVFLRLKKPSWMAKEKKEA